MRRRARGGRERDRSQRQRLSGERHHRLRGHPHGRLVAPARVPHVPIGGDQRSQVRKRRRGDPRRCSVPGLTPAAIRPWTAQAVDWAFESSPGCDGNPPSRFCWARMNATARWGPGGRRAGSRQRLERGAGVVDVARGARRGEVVAPVGVLLAHQPRAASRAPRDDRAARSARIANEVRLTSPPTEPLRRTCAQQRRDQVTSAKRRGRQPGGAHRQDRALDRAHVGRAVDSAEAM